MNEIYLKIDSGVPQFAVDACYSCNSKFGISKCKVKYRGCCWYYPKFTLHDIHKMTKSEEGLAVLDRILKSDGTKVYNYFIHAAGYFEKDSYNEYLQTIEAYEDDAKDKTTYFRACPFVEDGKGCTLPAKFRSYVCNFFICDELKNEIEKNIEFNSYVKERDSYVKWLYYEDQSLEAMLKEKGLNLMASFDEVIEVLKAEPIEEYELIEIKPIKFDKELN